MFYLKRGKSWKLEFYQLSGEARLAGRTPDLYLSVMGRLISPGQHAASRVMTSYAVHVVEAGAGVVRADGKPYAVRAGDVFTLFPDHHYEYHNTPATPWRYTWLSLDGSQAGTALEHLGITPATPLLHGSISPSLQELFREIRAVYQRPTIAPTFAISAAWRLIDALAEIASTGAQPHDMADAARFLIDRQTIHTLSVEELARHLGASRTALFCHFREAYGMSPKEHLDSVRMGRAQRLLRQSASSLKEIAEACGYGSSQYFIQAFRRRHGLSPAKWRQGQSTMV